MPATGKKRLPAELRIRNRGLARYMLKCLGTINVGRLAAALQNVFASVILLPPFFSIGFSIHFAKVLFLIFSGTYLSIEYPER